MDSGVRSVKGRDEATVAARAPSESDPIATINLDANANAPSIPEVERAVIETMRSGAANPASAHQLGARARRIVEQARDAVASLVDGAYEDGVVFTSGCTEANNAVLRSLRGRRGATVITTPVEHSSVSAPLAAIADEGTEVRVLPVDRDGVCDPEVLRAWLLALPGPVLVSIQAANSETGVLQPMAAIAAIVDGHGDAILHADAAQAFGKGRIAMGRPFGPDVITVSGHKIHGPMGVGAIVMAPYEDRMTSLLLGGDQERGLRAGTQAVPAIAGFAAACRARSAAMDRHCATMTTLRDRFEALIASALPDAVVNGLGAARLPNTSNLRFPGSDGMEMVALLDASGVMCSQGSACNSMRPTPSPTLLALGLTEEEAYACVRFSLSPLNTVREIEAAADLVASAAHSSRRSA